MLPDGRRVRSPCEGSCIMPVALWLQRVWKMSLSREEKLRWFSQLSSLTTAGISHLIQCSFHSRYWCSSSGCSPWAPVGCCEDEWWETVLLLLPMKTVSRDRARFIFQVNIKEFKVLDKLQDPSINGSWSCQQSSHLFCQHSDWRVRLLISPVWSSPTPSPLPNFPAHVEQKTYEHSFNLNQNPNSVIWTRGM